jgi:hypothetical protein
MFCQVLRIDEPLDQQLEELRSVGRSDPGKCEMAKAGDVCLAEKRVHIHIQSRFVSKRRS